VQYVARESRHEVVALPRAALDVTYEKQGLAVLRRLAPDVVIHCAAYTRVDDAESDPAAAFLVNSLAAEFVARACATIGATMIYPSTDYVFAGTANRPYEVDAATTPLNVYGVSKAAGERAVLQFPGHFVVRTSWLYSVVGRDFAATILERGRAGQPLRVVDDQRGCPTWSHDLASTLLRLLEQSASPGIYHVCNRGAATWYEFACAVLELSGVRTQITAVKSADIGRAALRPSYSVLDCSATERIVGPIRAWRTALADALAHARAREANNRVPTC
jgi:dTDP-4-dehydrorhamnose reductase